MLKFLSLSGLTTLVTNIKNWANNRFALKTSIPTKISQLNNDSGYQTSSQVESKINSKIASVYRYKGTITSYSELPSSGQVVGDTYNITSADASKGIRAGDNVSWIGGNGGDNGDGWDNLGGAVDLSNYVEKESGKGLSTNDYSTTEKQKLAGLTNYVHPSYTSKSLGLYKVSVDATGHVNSSQAVSKSDITALGIPGENTDTKYNQATDSTLGLIMIGYGENGKNYPVELDEDGKAYVNVPWTDTNTVYTHPTTSGNKHIPSGGSSGQILRWSADGTATWGDDKDTTYTAFKGASSSAAGGIGLVPAPSSGASNRYLRSDGTWQVPPDTNTTYSNMTAATASAAGKSGLVPAPAAGAQTKYLRGDGTWQTPPNTTYSNATTSAAGLMSAADKSKLDGIASGANKYTLPTASKDVLGGVKTTSDIKSASGYTACPIIEGVPYYKDTNTTYTLSSFGITATAAELNYMDGVTSNVQTQLNGKAATGHAHNYAGSASAGGSANSAVKLDTETAGSATQPVYFNEGKPVACTYTLGKSVPSNAVFTDTVYTHPTTSGNKHIPSGGASGQILKWSADGTAAWGEPNKSHNYQMTMEAAGWIGDAAPYSIDLTVEGVTATNNVDIIPQASAEDQIDAWVGLGYMLGSQTEGKVTIKSWGDKPAVDIPITVIVRGD